MRNGDRSNAKSTREEGIMLQGHTEGSRKGDANWMGGGGEGRGGGGGGVAGMKKLKTEEPRLRIMERE